MKKANIILTFLIIFLYGISSVKAADYDYYCTKEAATQLAKIIYKEAGADSAVNTDDNFFMKISTAAVSVNNANSKDGNSFYEKIYNLTDSNYDGYSSYKDKSFESVVPSGNRQEVLYIAELVLTGKYTFPSNMTLQASESIVEQYGTVWSSVSNKEGFKDIYFGYEQGSLNTTDIYNKIINDNSVSYYKSLASNLESINYSSYTVDTVCSGNSYPITNNNTTTNQQTTSNTAFEVCANPDILRVIYFFNIIIDIVKIIVPIALIIFGLIDFSKAVISNDEKDQKKTVNLFVKRLLYGVLIFAVPWIVEVLMITLGNLFDEDNVGNFTDCLENANSECIDALDSNNINTIKESCDVPDNFRIEDDTNKNKSCWQCNNNPNLYQWGESASHPNCHAGWHELNNKTKEQCK